MLKQDVADRERASKEATVSPMTMIVGSGMLGPRPPLSEHYLPHPLRRRTHLGGFPPMLIHFAPKLVAGELAVGRRKVFPIHVRSFDVDSPERMRMRERKLRAVNCRSWTSVHRETWPLQHTRLSGAVGGSKRA